jgi:choline dehydrogenase-like flavoprotein
MQEFDYIVVGAGSAGCALADRLSQSGRHSVLVLEAGGSDSRFWIKVPIGYGRTFYDGTVNWKFETEPDPGLGGRRGYWPRGRVVGGSSSINALVYCRGLPGDFDDWRAAGNPGWGWDDVRPVFAGAVGSPQILQLSGIGDGARLKAVGVTPRHELPGVGGNLQDHLSTNADIDRVVAGGRFIRRMAETKAMRALIRAAIPPLLQPMSDEAIVEDFRARCGTVFHPVGTCRMGPEAGGAVVDAGLRVHGVGRLRVVDASIFPNVTSGNTNAPAIMVGRKGAELILAEG